MQLENWDDLRFLLAIKRCRSISESAKRLDVNKTTVSRRLEALNLALGEALVHRKPGGMMELTAYGESIAEYAELIEHHIDQINEISGRQSEYAGVVRVTSVPFIVNRLLIPKLNVLTETHPKLEIEVIPDSRDLNLSHGEADIAIRLARPTVGGAKIKIKKIGELPCSVFVAKDSARKEASKLPWIVYDDSLAHIAPNRWMRSAAANASEPLAQVKVHDAESALQAVLLGLGKTVLPDVIATNDTRLQRLSTSGSKSPPARELWLLGRSNQTHLKRITAVVKWVESAFL